MNQIIQDSVDAFCEGREFARSNMHVHVWNDRVLMYQHGNLIAQRPIDGSLYDTWLSNAGWWTVTTKARLDALLERITMGAWGLYSDHGEWVLYSRKHGEHPPFTGSIDVQTLIQLDDTIEQEREARKRSWALALEGRVLCQ